MYRWAGMSHIEHSKNINTRLLGMWRPKGDKGKIHHLQPFLIPFIHELEELYIQGKVITYWVIRFNDLFRC